MSFALHAVALLLQIAHSVPSAEVEAEALIAGAVVTHGKIGAQDMRPFGSGWGKDAQLFWGVSQPGAQLRLTVPTTVAGRYQVYLRFTRAPDFAFVRASFDGMPATSFNGFAPAVGRDRALLGMLDLQPGAHELLVTVVRKDRRSTGFNVGLDGIVLEPVTASPAPTEGTRAGPARTTPVRTASVPSASVPTEGGGTAVVPVAPKIAAPSLSFSRFTADGPKAQPGGTETSIHRPNLTVDLTWQAPAEGQVTYRWQVATQPFPRTLAWSAPPPGLVSQGPAALDQRRSFTLALGTLPPLNARRGGSTPLDLHVRIIPMADGSTAGPPSNGVVVRVMPGAAPDIAGEAIAKDAERERRLAEMREQARIYRLQLVRFKPMVFEDPNTWGCVTVIRNPYYGNALHPLREYRPGEDYCGKSYKGMGSGIDNLWDVATGWVKAYDIVAGFYDDAKSYVADKLAHAVPCAFLGSEAASTCHQLATEVASSGLSAGLVAAGVPPSLPNMQQLGSLAKAKVAEAGADYTCQQFETHGQQCTPAQRDELEKAYREAIDKIQLGLIRATKEPGCGDEKLANENGRHALPCFLDFPGTDVRPAPGAVTELPAVTVRVTRVKPDPDFPMPGCRLGVLLKVTNHFPGATISGVPYDPAPIGGLPFEPARSGMPVVPLGKSIEVTIPFQRVMPFWVPKHHGSPWWSDWQYLYRGGAGILWFGATTVTPVPGALLIGNRPTTLECAAEEKASVQIPR